MKKFLFLICGLLLATEAHAQLNVLAAEATAAQRTVYFRCVDATDGITAETGEAGGQPQISTNGAAFTNTGIGVLGTYMGHAIYPAILTQAAVTTVGDVIVGAFKSAATAECFMIPSAVVVVAYDPYSTTLGLGTLSANVVSLLGTAWLTPGTAGTPDVNVKLWNGLSTVALPLIPTVAGRTLDVSATGEGGIDWANIGSPTTTVNLSGTTTKTVTDIATQIAALNNLSQANIRTALGMGSANMDTQLDALPTNAELATALGTADDAVLAAIAAGVPLAANSVSSSSVATTAVTELQTGLYTLRSGVAVPNFPISFTMADGSAATGLTDIVCYSSLDGSGAYATITDTSETEVGDGDYVVSLTSGEVTGALLMFKCSSAVATGPDFKTFYFLQQ